jgi:hypothetical protein
MVAEIKLTGFKNGRQSTVGDTDTAMIDGSLTIGGGVEEDTVLFNAEIDSDFIPDDNDSFDLGSDTKRWAAGHFVGLAFLDVLSVELAIPNVPLQSDSYAFRWTVPYDVELIELEIYIDTKGGQSGNVTVEVKNSSDVNIFSATAITTSLIGEDTTPGPGSENLVARERVTFAITTALTAATGLRANLFFRRRNL